MSRGNILYFLKHNVMGVVAAVASNIFGAFNYLAARRIGSQVHPCIETMYIGIV